MQDLTKSHLFKYKSEIQRIAKPLFDGSIISAFGYTRQYKNDTVISLSTVPEIPNEAYNQGIQTTFSELKFLKKCHANINKNSNSFYYFLEENNLPAKKLNNEYDLKSILIMVDDYHDYFNLYIYPLKTDQNVMNYLFNNWSMLLKFKHYFMGSTKKLLPQLENEKIQLFNNRKKTYTNITGIIKDNITPKHYYLSNFHNKEISITAKELQALKHFSQGRTLKQIGQYMNISPRTAQNYQNILARKLSVFTRSQIIDLYLRSDLVML